MKNVSLHLAMVTDCSAPMKPVHTSTLPEQQGASHSWTLEGKLPIFLSSVVTIFS